MHRPLRSLCSLTRSLWPSRQARPARYRRRRDTRQLAVQQLEPKIALSADSNFMEFVLVGDPGNAARWGGSDGAVDYEYRIGKYEVTIGQYTEFLNAVAKSDTYGLWNRSFMDFFGVGAGIQRTGTDGTFVYEAIGPRGVTPPGADSPDLRPITGVTWLDAARFANWMSNGRPDGAQAATTTEDGAYTLNGLPEGQAFEPLARNAVNPNTGSTPSFFLPSRSEWYKAAYYSPVKNGPNAPGYHTYATQSDVNPGNAIGAEPNNANVRGDGEWPNQPYAVTQSADFSDQDQNYFTNVGAFSGSASYYGTFDQQGNVAELTDTFEESYFTPGTYYVDVLGGHWYYYATTEGQSQGSQAWTHEGYYDGFRVAGTFDYSNDPAEPTSREFSTAGSGLTLVLSNTAGGSADTRDYATFTVPDGQRLTSFVLDDYESSDTRAFIGIQSGAAVTATAADPSQLLGYTHFGPGATGAGVGADLIDLLGGPLDAGTYSVWIQQLGASTDYHFTLETTNLNAPPTALQFEPPALSLPEDTDTSGRIKLADIVVIDDEFGTNVVELLGFTSSPAVMRAFEVDDLFEIDEFALYLKAGVALDFEVASSFEVSVSVRDTSLPFGDSMTSSFTLTVSDVNEPPEGVTLSSWSRLIADGTSRADRIRMADIGILGDLVGDHAVTLSGPDAESFEVEDFVLYLKAGTTLDRVAKPTYAVSVNLRDASLPGSTAVTATFKVTVAVPPGLVADINQMPVGSNPRNLAVAGDFGYFAVRDPAGPSGSSGLQLSLWKTDGTTEGTVRVGPDQLSLGSSQPSMAAIGSTLFFVGSDGTSEFGLWKTDGTESGTVLISPEGLSLARRSDYGGFVTPYELKAVGSTLFFVASDEESGRELWKTDGTPEGTVQVGDIRSGEYGSRPAYLTATDSTLYFVANDGTSGRQLWKTDGTDGGTVQLTDLADAGYGNAWGLTAVGSTLYFTADDGTSGRELWKTNGSPEGTVLVKDLFAGSSGSNPLSLTAVGSTLFFIASDSADEFALWKTNGTAEGTVRVTSAGLSVGTAYSSDGSTWFSPNEMVAFGDATLFFVADDGTSGKELWKTDGTEQGTSRVADVVAGEDGAWPARLTPVGEELFFFASGNKLWKTSGTSAGTSQVATIGDEDYGGSGSYGAMAVLNGSLLFADDDGEHGTELWVADIATGQTNLVKDIDSSNQGAFSSFAYGGESAIVGSTLFFAANDGTSGRNVWKIDETGQPAVQITDFSDDHGGVRNLTAVGSQLYFTVLNNSDEFGGTSLWRTDGTEPGTVRVASFPVFGDDVLEHFTPVGSTLYFTAYDEMAGSELWKSDGTPGGTVLVKDIRAGVLSSSPGDLIAVGSTLYFTAYDGVAGWELWKTDGTEPGTVLVKDIYEGAVSSSPRYKTAIGSTLYFTAGDSVSGWELWKTDGTGPGTVLVKDIRQGFGFSNPRHLTAVGSTLYFTADDGVSGRELWKSDGTGPGTVIVKDIRPGDSGSGPSSLAAVGSMLYFTADDGVSGTELWKTDGTAQGTVLVADLTPGTVYSYWDRGDVPAGSYLHGLTPIGSVLFFANGSSLWKTDGSTSGTVQISDDSLSVSRLIGAVGPTIYMVADDGATGLELWRFTDNVAPTGVALAPAAVSIAENASTTSRIKLADIVITDDASGTNTVTLSGPDAANFEVVGLELFLKVGVTLDLETKQSYAVTVNVADAAVPGSTPVAAGFTLTVTDVNDVAPVFTSGATGSVAENAPISTAIYTAATTDADGTSANRAVTYSIKPGVGDATLVGIDATTGVVTLLASADFEAKSSYAFTVVATNAGTGVTLVTEQAVTVAVTNVNEAPTSVSLTNTTTTIAENTSTASRIKVADIVVTDDALGTNTITLSGPDAANFEVVGLALFLKSGVTLDFETKQSYAVTVNVADATVSGSAPVAAGFTLTVTDVPELAVISLPTPFANTVTEDAGVDASGFLVTTGTFGISDPDAGQAAFKTTVGVPAGVTNLGTLTISAGGAFTYRVLSSLDAVQALRAGQNRSEVFTIESLDGTKLDVTFSIAGVADVLSGIVADGYLAGATVFADANGNRVLDTGELSTTTDNAGNFSFDFGSLTATLISIGGTDISTGLPFAGSLTAPAGSRVINPLTTLVTAVVEAGGAPADASALAAAVAAATTQVVAGLGLPAVDLTTFDPLAPGADPAAALAVQKAAASVANVIVVGNTVGADPAAVVRNLAAAVTTTGAGQTVDLTSATVLTSLLTTPTTPAPATAAIGSLASSNTQIAAAGTIAAIAELQTVVQSAGGFVQENAATSTVIYQTAVPAGMTAPVFSLKDVAGDDRALVSIDAATGAVRLLAPADFETKRSYRFTVVASQDGQATVETAVTVAVTDVNEAPTAIALSAVSVPENEAIGTVIGTLTATDPDAGDSMTYALVAGEGGTDNAAFTLDGGVLKAARAFNVEVRQSYSIRVRATDTAGLSTESVFTINVTDVADEPLVVEAFTPPPAGAFGAGRRVLFTVTLSDAARVRGKPQLQVRAGGVTRTATYVSGSGSAVLTFQYVVGKNDHADAVSLGQKFIFAKRSGITAGARSLAAALPAGIAGAAADGVRIDARAPKVVGKVGVPGSGTYTVGQSLDFVVRFSEAVIVGGTPRIGLTGLNGARQATYVSGSGSQELRFHYVVQESDVLRGKKGPGLAKAISLAGGAVINDEAGNRAVLAISTPSLRGVKLDTSTVTAASGFASAASGGVSASAKRNRTAAFASLG